MQFPVFTVSDVRELCLLGLRDYAFVQFQLSENFARTLCSFLGLSHPFWRCFSNQTNSVFDFNCCCYSVPWLWFKPEYIPKIQNKDKLQGWWALRPALRCIHDAFNSDTFTLVVHMSVIMGFFGGRNTIALKVSGLIHNRRTFLLHPHPPPTAPAHTHTHSLSLRKSRYMSDSWSGTNRDWARSLTSLTDILSLSLCPPHSFVRSLSVFDLHLAADRWR